MTGREEMKAESGFIKPHQWLKFFRKRQILPRWAQRSSEEDTRPWYEATFIFQARDMAQAEFLFLAMEDGLGCPDDPDHVCEHFRLGGLHEMDED